MVDDGLHSLNQRLAIGRSMAPCIDVLAGHDLRRRRYGKLDGQRDALGCDRPALGNVTPVYFRDIIVGRHAVSDDVIHFEHH